MFHNPDLKVAPPTASEPSAHRLTCDDSRCGRRPRIAIMGEFSAGKSTLTNMLIGANALPTKVTATQLPPVWLSHGTGRPQGVDLSDTAFDVDFERLDDIPLASTQYLRVKHPASVLELCDIIDFPGISDPNMPAETWQRVISEADAVIWCSHAVQAWRQSEAAVWDEMPLELRERSLLLLTRMDKLTEERDRRRVLSRVRSETAGLFAQVFPISLTRALAAGDDRAAWEASGAEAFMTALLELVMNLSKTLAQEVPAVRTVLSKDQDQGSELGPADNRRDMPGVKDLCGSPVTDRSVEDAAPEPGRIVPRRVSLKGSPRRPARPRPVAETTSDSFGQS